ATRQVGRAVAGVGVIDAVRVAVSPPPFLPRLGLAPAVPVDPADAPHAPQEAVLEVDEALAVEFVGARPGGRAPARHVGTVGDVSAEQPLGPAEPIGDARRGVDPQEDLVAQVLVAAIDPANLVDDAAAPIADLELDPDLALLAEPGGHPVTGADV